MRKFPKREVVFPEIVLKELVLALDEVGQIKPWYDVDCQTWVFSHELYPSVEYSGDSKEEVIAGYPFYLGEFIKYRLQGQVHPVDQAKTKGRGGMRPGSGRPKKGPTKRKYLPADVAAWLDRDENLEKVRRLMRQ